MRMRRKSSASRDSVVVHHPQGAKLHMLWIEIICKRKCKARIQPAVVGMAAVIAFANVDHGQLLEIESIILVITTIVKRRIRPTKNCSYPCFFFYLAKPFNKLSWSRLHAASVPLRSFRFLPLLLWCTVVFYEV